jgi:DNA-binding GntR family transcriptional regulator
MALSHEDVIMDVFKRIDHSKDYSLRIEIDRIYFDLTKKDTLGLSYKFNELIKRAYKEDRDALRKAMIAIIQHSSSYFKEQITNYPSLKEEYEGKISHNNELIENLRKLW